MWKQYVSNTATLFPDDRSQFGWIKLKALVKGWNKLTWINMQVTDESTYESLMNALKVINAIQEHDSNTDAGKLAKLDGWRVGSSYRIRFAIYSLDEKVLNSVFSLINKCSQVQLPLDEIKQAIANIFSNVNQSNYKSGMTVFNPAPTVATNQYAAQKNWFGRGFWEGYK